MAVTQYIGARYVPLFATPLEWDNTKTYEPLTIVIHNGNSYTSRQSVPTGIDILNENYWALTGNYNSQIEQYRSEVKGISKEVSEVTDTANSAKTAADSAVTAANSAKTTADNAVTTANTAKTTADNAVKTANIANNTANNANSTAGEALTAAESAEKTAGKANTTANNASTKVDTYDARIKTLEQVGVKLNANQSNTTINISTLPSVPEQSFLKYSYLLITYRIGDTTSNFIYKTALVNTYYMAYRPHNLELSITKAFDNELVIYSSYWYIAADTITAQANKTYALSSGSSTVTTGEIYIVDVRGVVVAPY